VIRKGRINPEVAALAPSLLQEEAQEDSQSLKTQLITNCFIG